MSDFEKELYGLYDVPEAAKEVQSDSGYYQHPLGVYVGRIGSMEFKYVNLEGKKCKSTDVGAIPSRAVLRIYLEKYLGQQESPEMVQLLNADLSLPIDKTSFELYYPDTLSLSQKFQWATIKKFDKFVIPDINDSQIIKGNAVRYDKFRLYYGLQVKFILMATAKDFRYISEIVLLDTPRVPIPNMKQLEDNVNNLQQQERDAKDKTSSSVPQPDASVDDILSGYIAPNPAGNDKIEDDDLPF